jgi:hypothetical protein
VLLKVRPFAPHVFALLMHMDAAIIEYAVQADLPDNVFDHPTVIAMSQAATDILTWPNDLASFNVSFVVPSCPAAWLTLPQKEQAEGDYQNFVCVLMRERGLSLQSAVDTLTNMIASRVGEYIQLRAALPSFGAEADAHLRRYLAEVEHETYGAVRWWYESKRMRPLLLATFSGSCSFQGIGGRT